MKKLTPSLLLALASGISTSGLFNVNRLPSNGLDHIDEAYSTVKSCWDEDASGRSLNSLEFSSESGKQFTVSLSGGGEEN